jgi:hypothetical protein
MTISCICDPSGIFTFLHTIARAPAAGGILAALVGGYVFTSPASDDPENPAVIKIAAAAIPGPAFEWDNPGTNPNRMTSDHSIDVLVRHGALPVHVGEAFKAALARGASPEVREIPDGAMFNGMVFGEDAFVPRVRAATAKWPSGVSRNADVYTYFDPAAKRLWILTRPHACDNFSVATAAIWCECVQNQ